MTDTFKERLDHALAIDSLATNSAHHPPRRDDPHEVRRPDDPRTGSPVLTRLESLHEPVALPRHPVYDPFSARRRRRPEWLVAYTAALVVGDIAAALAGA